MSADLGRGGNSKSAESTLSHKLGDAEPGFRDLFTPKLITVLREGYGLSALRADAVAGLTVAIVALPLSMAIAIASGVSPDRGLFTAIVGGFLVSALGGSRFQVGGPAGAFIVLVAATVERHGVDGLLLATLMAGLFLVAIGLLRLGTYIKFIPYPVTVGFTAGIAVIIFASQLRDLFGLALPGAEPGPLVEKLPALWRAADTASPAAFAVAFFTVAVIVTLKRLRPGWPGMLVAIALASVFTVVLSLPVETIGTRFGGIPRLPPAPSLPPLGWEKIVAVLPDAVAFALLGAIESLLSAVVADGMTGRRHRSNCELVGQGIANVGSALFGGICATGTIARTATNVRAGARGPVAGMLHAVFLLGFMLLAAPLARFIPLAALAGLLAFVAWNMVERHAIAAIVRSSRGEALVLGVTFALVVFRDLTEGIVVGFLLGAVLFLDRMARSIAVEAHVPFMADDLADTANGARAAYDAEVGSSPDTVVYRITGAFFFGSAATVGAVLDRIADRSRNFILDCSAVPFLDTTAANVIAGAARKAHGAGVRFVVAGASPPVRRMLLRQGVRRPFATYAANVEEAQNSVAKVKRAVARRR
ncbi:SulP family inorganic anion transporter [Nitratireductor mangrovi]|uniref:SulP family inorganic anion transporter n=1 Tax=Nitratireductor mangrovi TaxID=2599600 RepID=A0A5B8KZ76_9HYPH|nr:SulP family inorganic anion transporter [Nitratireductor mangrovi]QDZ00740.1 SulP family inorganic anion transporter [Nitratireductor mangrovi]